MIEIARGHFEGVQYARLPDPGSALLQDLRTCLAKAGCFERSPVAYAVKITALLAMLAAGYAALLSPVSPIVRVALALWMAIGLVQAGFLAHDAMDGAITTNRRLGAALAQLLMSLVGGVSSTYYDYLHGLHHIAVHRGSKGGGVDPVNPYELVWFKRALANNGLLFAAVTIVLRPVLLQVESVRYVFRNRARTKTDRLLMAVHAIAWFIIPLPFIGFVQTVTTYALIALFAGPYIGTILVLNHEGMVSAQDDEKDIPAIERVTRSTRNLGQSWWADLLTGGISNHIEHHLFPEIPAMRLRKARNITRQFCCDNGIAYTETTFARALIEAAKYFRACPPERLVTEPLS